jgi:glycosyltransferase involved in cell wall biosynthesis
MKSIVFVSRASNRGGTAYEKKVREIIKTNNNPEDLLLDISKNKWLVFKKLKFFVQVFFFKPKTIPDILITNSAGVYAGILKKEAKKRVLIFHHFDESEFENLFWYKYLNKSFFSSLKNFDCIVVVADYWKKFLEQYVTSEKLVIIQNSFDVEEIEKNKLAFDRESFLKKYNIPSDKIIVYAGNALKIKGFEKVIKLLPRNRFFVITSGNKDVDIDHLHLNLSFKEYIHLLCASDITVLLSGFKEGWNRIAHESILCGTPVIGTNVGGMGELLKNTNQVIYKEGDDLEMVIEKVLKNDNKINPNISEFAVQFDEQYFKSKWIQLINKL